MPSLKIAPSILAADPLQLGAELANAESAGADWHHLDVMDGHYVPNLTFGLPLIKAVKKVSKLPLDVHIMVTNPDEVAMHYVDAGADILVFHVEAARHAHRLVQSIHARGAKAGLAINPGTPLEALEPLLEEVDLINVMSVNPGFGGQSFIPLSVERITRLYDWLLRKRLQERVLIQVDGGIDDSNVAKVVRAGASVLVAGSYIYGHKDRKARIQSLRNQCSIPDVP